WVGGRGETVTRPVGACVWGGPAAGGARRRFDGLELNQKRAVLRSLLHPELPIIVRSVTDARTSGKPRIEVRPDWQPALERAKAARPNARGRRAYKREEFEETQRAIDAE